MCDTLLDWGSFYIKYTCIKFNLWKFHSDMLHFHRPARFSHFNEISELLKNSQLGIFAFRIGVCFMDSFQIVLINEQMDTTKFPWNRTNFLRPVTIKSFLRKYKKKLKLTEYPNFSYEVGLNRDRFRFYCAMCMSEFKSVKASHGMI